MWAQGPTAGSISVKPVGRFLSLQISPTIHMRRLRTERFVARRFVKTMRLRWLVNATGHEIAVLSDDIHAVAKFADSERFSAVHVVRTEQVLFGALVGVKMIIRDSATSSVPVLLPSDAAVHDVEDVDAAVDVASALLSASQQPGAGPVIAVMNAVGGSGASALAWLISAHYALTSTTVLVDADDRSPGLDLWTCHERAAAVRWNELHDVTSAVHPSRLWDCLIHVTPTLRLLSHGRSAVNPSSSAASIVLSALEPHAVVVDLSSTRSSELKSHVLERANLVIIISTASVSGCAAAQSAITRLTREGESETRRIVCALRTTRFGVSMAAARSVISVPVISLPEDVRMLRALRERQFNSLPNRRWKALTHVLPAPRSHARPLSNPVRRLTPTTLAEPASSEQFRMGVKASRLHVLAISRLRAFTSGR